jgi:hypothetical protein
MKADEAVRFVNGLAFKPGWRPVAQTIMGNNIVLSFLIETVDTSYPDGDGICRRQIGIIGQERTVNVLGMDEAALLCEVLKCAAENDEHENREFLKVRQPGGSWQAPLHPHTSAGNRVWREHHHQAPAGDQAGRESDALDRLLELLGDSPR